jgi:hypothetical protein
MLGSTETFRALEAPTDAVATTDLAVEIGE